MESVLVGVDSSEESRRALGFALRRAKLNEWRVTVAHVVNWNRYSTFHTHEDNERRPVVREQEIEQANSELLQPLLAEANSEGLLDGVQLDTVIRHGRPSEVLADLAEEQQHDLIVVGRTGDSQLKTAFFGSTSLRLVQHASVPVVVVP